MRNFILTLVLSFNFIYSYSQNSEITENESYILTTDGERIPIVSDEEITIGGNNVTYCASKTFKKTVFLKQDVNKEIPVKTYKFEREKINIKDVKKIVVNEKLYLPIKSKKGYKIYREILKNKTHTLGYYNYSVPGGNSLVLLVLDNKTNEEVDRSYIDSDVADKTLGTDNKKIDKKLEKNIAFIKKYFGNCIDKDELVVNKYTEPYKLFLKGEESTVEKEKEWEKFIRGSLIHIGYLLPSFEILPKYNQYQCE